VLVPKIFQIFPKKLYIYLNYVLFIFNLLQIELDTLSADVGSVSRTTTYLSAYGLRSKSFSAIQCDDTRFSIPSKVLKQLSYTSTCSKVIGKNIGNVSACLDNPFELENRCFQANLVAFKQNPYHYRQYSQQSPVESVYGQDLLDVVSLSLFPCHGQEQYVVKDLNDTVGMIDVVISHTPLSVIPNYTLDKQFMNIHAFNLSKSMSTMQLHIDITLLPYTEDTRLFPVHIYLKSDTLPHPSSSQKIGEIPLLQSSASILINASLLTFRNGRSVNYLGLLDGLYAQGRVGADQATSRQYQLSIWAGECIYWDELNLVWSKSGCNLVDSDSTYLQTHCR